MCSKVYLLEHNGMSSSVVVHNGIVVSTSSVVSRWAIGSRFETLRVYYESKHGILWRIVINGTKDKGYKESYCITRGLYKGTKVSSEVARAYNARLAATRRSRRIRFSTWD